MVYFTRRFVLCLTLCRFVLVFSDLLVLRLPRLGKSELILVIFVRLFDLCLFWICQVPFPLGVWEGLQFVIVAIPGLFSFSLRVTTFMFIVATCVVLFIIKLLLVLLFS